MNAFSKHLLAALMGVAIFSSCSRPVAYFQPSHTERFTAPKTETVAVSTPVEVTQPVAAETPASVITPAPAEQLVQAKQAMSQVEAYVRNDAKLAADRKLSRRIEKLDRMLTAANDKTVSPANVTAPKKMNLMERVMLKKLDRKIKNSAAPNKTNEMSSNLKLGIIIAIAGLLLAIIFGGVLGVIGYIGLLVGIVLIILELLRQA